MFKITDKKIFVKSLITSAVIAVVTGTAVYLCIVFEDMKVFNLAFVFSTALPTLFIILTILFYDHYKSQTLRKRK